MDGIVAGLKTCTLVAMPLITVASNKGGVGKTTLAIELAYSLGAVLVDLDHDDGGATAGWPEVGTLAPEFARRALLAGDGPGPRVLAREGLPALIPAHPDYGATSLPPEVIADRLTSWAEALAPRALIVDTHPGFQAYSLGAMMAARFTLVPVLLQERELRAFAGAVREFERYQLASIPYRVPVAHIGDLFYGQRSVAPLRERWAEIARDGGVRIGPTVHEWREWPRRKVARALLAAGRPGAWVAAAQAELREVAAWMAELAGLPAPAEVPGG